MSGSFGLTTPHPHFDCLDNLSTKTTWQMKAILRGQTLLPTRVLKGHTQVMTSSEIFHAEQPKLTWTGFFLLTLLFCENLLAKVLMEGTMLSGNVLHQAQAWLLYLLSFAFLHLWQSLVQCAALERILVQPRGCSDHGLTVLSVGWQVKKNECPAGSSQAFRPATKLGGFVQLICYMVHQVLPSSLATLETQGKVTGCVNSVLSMHICHYCWLQLGVLHTWPPTSVVQYARSLSHWW